MGRSIAIGGAVLFGIVVLIGAFVVGSWALDGRNAEREAQAFCGAIAPGTTVDQLEAAIADDSEVFDSFGSVSAGGNGPQPTVERGEHWCWCGTNFEDGRLISVDELFCID